MIREFDTVALLRALPEHGLSRGDLGAVVHVYPEAYEVEFVRADGTTQTLLTLADRDIRLVPENEFASLEAAK